MLSYRHAFHAGNHADVLKHLVLVQLLDYLNQKDKPWWFYDTHAGAGIYPLSLGPATQNTEHADGIERLWHWPDLPGALPAYLDAVRAFNTDGHLRRYPGSPYIALKKAREADRLRLFELHPTDDVQLRENLTRDFPKDHRRVEIRHVDGFHELKALLPPVSRRGLVLIDPAYEDKRDYLRVPATLKEGRARFATGMFAIWYPQLQRGDARQLPEKLRRLGGTKWLDVSLTVRAPAADGFGMHGSGMFVVNPPWTLAASLRETLPPLCAALAQDATASYALVTAEDVIGSAGAGAPGPRPK
jgi:23S rRNA (adenine2030-N6)-methyltransferase